MPKCVIVDVDGTLANTDHRQHFMKLEKKDWKNIAQKVLAIILITVGIVLVSGKR